MARNIEKMNTKIAEIKAKYPKVETKYVVADFSKLSTIQEYRDIINEGVGEIDIAFVGMNAGLARSGSLAKIPDKYLEEVIRVNALQVVYASKVFLEILMKLL